MSCIWAVARNMLAESIRMKIALVFIMIILVLLPVLPFVCAGDGLTLKSRVQSFLVYSLGSVGFLLSILTVFLSCASLSNEIREKSILMIVSKPIPRWQLFVGKWLGISLLNAGLLLFTGLTVWGFTYYLRSRPTNVANDRAALEHEVLSVRHGIPMREPDFTAEVDEQIRRLREENRLDDISSDGIATAKAEILNALKMSWRAIGRGQEKEFVFKGLMVNREQGGYLHLKLKPTSSSGLRDEPIKILWQCGDLNDPNTRTPTQEWNLIMERVAEIPVPTYAVNKEGTLYVRMFNTHPQFGVVFEGEDSFEVLFDIGPFHWNLLRALSIIWCRLAFLAVVGVLMSTFLSFPVACMACLLVFLVAVSAGFLKDSIEGSRMRSAGQDPLWVVGPVARPLGSAFVWVVPDFSEHDAVENVASGRNVPLKWVIYSVVLLLLIKGLILGVLGCVILTRRELAQVVV